MAEIEERSHRLTEPILRKAIAVFRDVPEAEVKDVKFDVKSGSGAGENFSCVLKAVQVAATVKGEERTYPFMTKCFPMSEFRVAMLRESGAFAKEVPFYTEIYPKLNKMDPELCMPTGYYGSIDEGVLVMEDMKVKGFDMIDASKGLPLKQLKMALAQLARLHAASYDFIEKFSGGPGGFRAKYPDFFHDGWIRSDTKDGERMNFIYMCMSVFTLVAVTKEFCKEGDIGARMDRFGANVRERLDRLFKQEMGGFQSLLHLDAWCNNFMFTADREKICLLDLECLRYGRPTVDLAYFLGSSTTPKFREENVDDLLKHYYAVLEERLKAYGHNPQAVYSFDKFMKEFNEDFIFGLVMGGLHAQIQLSDTSVPDVIFDPTTLVDDEEQMNKQLEKVKAAQIGHAKSNEKLGQRFVELAREMDKYGYLK